MDQCVKRACSLEHRKTKSDLTTATSRQGPQFRLRAEACFLDYAAWAATSFDDQLNSVPSTHMRCRMTASLRATATLALRRLLRLAIRIPQDLSADHFAMRVSSTLAASYR